MEVLQTGRRSQNFSTIAYWQFIASRAIFSCRAANKELEVQGVIDTINNGLDDGTLYLRGSVCTLLGNDTN